ncbi:hypothetical protein MKW92_041669 [Papaver armeniacum]|nr:hypothetical protein MKW92_041669 [Papaver armeniacum]
MVVLRSSSKDDLGFHPDNFRPPLPKEPKYTSKQIDDLVRPYAADAMRFYNKVEGTRYELVEPGCLTPVLLRRTDLLHHVDFMAKKTDAADAPEEMFFAELTTTNGVHYVKDKNRGCCYCRWYNNVQHPKGGGFSRGCHGLFRDDGTGSSSSSNPKNLRSMDVPDTDYLVAKPKKEHKHTYVARLYAAETLKFYDKRPIIEPGHVTSVLLKTCILQHVDFTAKKTDVTDAPEEMFFAELITTSGVRCVKFCRRMGPRDSISGGKNNGCCYCTHENVQHPKGGGFSCGFKSFFEQLKDDKTLLRPRPYKNLQSSF